MSKMLVLIGLVFANVCFADCVDVINGYRVEMARAGVIPIATHMGGASVGESYRIVNEMKEMQLISDAREGQDSKLMNQFHQLVNNTLSQFESHKQISREELITAIQDASSKNQICGEYYGAMSLSQAASVIAAGFVR